MSKEWTILENHIDGEPSGFDYSYAVPHSFGRGSFKSLAEQVIIPKIVLDKIILGEGNNKCWSERTSPRGQKVGGAASARMGGVNVNVVVRPKSSGRARALQIRTQWPHNTRRPGQSRLRTPQLQPPTPQGGTVGGRGRAKMKASCPSNLPSPSERLQGMYQGPSSEGVYQEDPVASNDSTSPSVLNDDYEDSSSGTDTTSSNDNICSIPAPTSDSSPSSIPEPDIKSSPTEPTFVKLDTKSNIESEGDDRPDDVSWSEERVINELKSISAATQCEGEDLDWSMDGNTLCFSNLPDSITAKELVQCVETFGVVSHCKVVHKTEEIEGASSPSLSSVAYIRMKKKSSCEWVISCFHGNSFEKSAKPVVCTYMISPQD